MVIYLIPAYRHGRRGRLTPMRCYPHCTAAALLRRDRERAEGGQDGAAQLRSSATEDNPVILNLFEHAWASRLIQQQILIVEAEKLGIHATPDDVRQYFDRLGRRGPVPGGKFIRRRQYSALVANRFNMSVPEFEEDVRTDIAIRRLQHSSLAV